MVFPWIPFLFGRRKRLSDIEFLSIKDFDGKIVKNKGQVTADGTLATLTASSGKDMYLGTAKVSYTGDTSVGTERAVVELQINAVIVEVVRFISQGAADGISQSYEFKNIGHKVAATQVIRLQVTGVIGTVSLEGYVECFEETTGESPQIG